MLQQYSRKIKDFAVVTPELYCQSLVSIRPRTEDFQYNVYSEAGFGVDLDVVLYALNPSSYWDESLDINWTADPTSSLGPSETLYTARGTQGMSLYSGTVEDMGLDKDNYMSTFIFEDEGHEDYGNRAYHKRLLW